MRAALFTALVAVVLGASGCPGSEKSSAAASATPNTEDEKTLYALGLSIGQSVKMFNLTEAELALVKRGIEDQVLGQKPLVELRDYGPKIGGLARTRGNKAAEAEKQKGTAYIAQAEKEAGAEKLASGVIYKELQAGTGEQPTSTSMVKVNYRGTLVDGTEFDSSYKRNMPAEFALNGVVRCWTEGVQKMKVGGKAKLVCPPETAYGDRGAPPNVPGGATLTFEVELLEVKAQPGPPPAPGAPMTPPPAPTTPPPAQKPVSK